MELPQTHSKQLFTKLERLPFSENDIYGLVNKQADLFPILDLRYLAMSSTNKFQLFKQLLSSIEQFNKTLEDWHKGKIQIASIRTEYNIYSNLKTRLQTINLIPNEDLLQKNLQQCLQWFEQVTTKKFKHNVDQLFETLRTTTKQSKTNVSTQDQIYLMYKRMGRTQHGQIPPPSERLVHYKKRQSVFPIQDLTATKQSFYSERKINFFGMTTSGKDTIQSTARDINTADIQQQDGMPLENEHYLQGISEGNQNQSIAFEKNYKKVYADNEDDGETKKRFKKANLTGKLKLLNKQSHLTKGKLEEIEMIKQMNNWTKHKSRKQTQVSKMIQSRSRQATNGILQPMFSKELRKRTQSLRTMKSLTLTGASVGIAYNPELFPETKQSLDFTRLSNSRNKLSFMDKIGKLNLNIKNQNIKQALKENLKNIQHCAVNDLKQTEQDVRYTSQSSTRPRLPPKTLTSFMKKRSSSVADILQKNSLTAENQHNLEIAEKIKQSLLKKGAYLGNKTIQNSLMQYIHKGQDQINIYKSGQKLLSNPWFPKTKTKKSKKKF